MAVTAFAKNAHHIFFTGSLIRIWLHWLQMQIALTFSKYCQTSKMDSSEYVSTWHDALFMTTKLKYTKLFWIILCGFLLSLKLRFNTFLSLSAFFPFNIFCESTNYDSSNSSLLIRTHLQCKKYYLVS